MPTTATTQNYVWDDCSVIPPSAINPTGPDGSMTIITDPASYLGAFIRRSGVTTGALALISADLHIQKGPFGTVNEGDRLAG